MSIIGSDISYENLKIGELIIFSFLSQVLIEKSKTKGADHPVSTFLLLFFLQKISNIVSALMLRHEMPLQTGNHQQANQTGSETAIVQTHATVKYRQSGHHAEVHHGSDHTVEPAVFVRNRAEAVGIAQSHDNGLGIEELCKFRPEEGG